MTLALLLAFAVVSLHAQTTSPAAIHVLASHEVQIGAVKARYELTAVPHAITRGIGATAWKSTGMLIELRAYTPGNDGPENDGKLLWRKFEPEWDKRYHLLARSPMGLSLTERDQRNRGLSGLVRLL